MNEPEVIENVIENGQGGRAIVHRVPLIDDDDPPTDPHDELPKDGGDAFVYGESVPETTIERTGPLEAVSFGSPVTAAQMHEAVRKAAEFTAHVVGQLPQFTLERETTPLADALTETVDHPAHYNGHPTGIECIDVTEHAGFNVGNAIKYLWRTEWGEKGDPVENLRKAAWYIQRELDKRGAPGD